MKEEKRCWFCRRTAKEVMKDAPILTCDIPEKDIVYKEKVYDMDNFYICQGCNELLWFLVHHNGKVDESSLVEFGDIETLFKKITEVFKKW
jgi:uncharacterized protein with PIN domain